MFKVMRITAFLIMMVVQCSFIIGCDKNISEAENNISDNTVVDGDMNGFYKTFVPITGADTELKIDEIILPETLNAMELYCSGIYDESNIIAVLYTKPQKIANEIGLYDFKADNYKKIIDISSYDGYFQICGFNEDYMILRLSEDEWRTCQLYYLSFEQMILTKFFSYSIDPEKNRVYAQNFNNIEIIGDKVYFDDYYEDTTGDLRVNLYEYIIGKQQLVPLLEDAQNPMVYNGEIVSFRKNSEGKFKDIVSVDNNLILSNTKHLKQITANKNGFFCIENNSTNDKTKITTFQIADMLKNKPVLSTDSSIDNLNSNSRFVTWRNYYEEKPYMYDTDKEQLLLFSDIPAGINNFFFSGELGLLMNSTEGDSKRRIFIFVPND